MINETLPASIANIKNEVRYVSCTETAKMVRQALREAFPEVKFSVRSSSYAGGASVRVAWNEGPLEDQVKSIVDVFSGSEFDGMTDCKNSNRHLINGNPVRFEADYIFCNRDVSYEKVKQAAAIFAKMPEKEWLNFMLRFDCKKAQEILYREKDAEGVAYLFLRNIDQPKFNGRASKTAKSVTKLGVL